MAYTPINWQTGDTITAEKLNKMDNGWAVSSTQLFSETVTTADDGDMNIGTLAYSSQISAPLLTVTFDGTDYECTMNDMDGVYAYGGVGPEGPDFTDYPFTIVSAVNMGEGNSIYTETASTHAVSATAGTVETSSAFRSAVLSVGALPMQCVSGVTTYDEMDAARASGRLMYFYDGDGRCFVVSDIGASPITTAPSTVDITANFEIIDNQQVFVVTVN